MKFAKLFWAGVIAVGLAGCESDHPTLNGNRNDPLPRLGSDPNALTAFTSPSGGFATEFPGTWHEVPGGGGNVLQLSYNLSDFGNQSDLGISIPSVESVAKLVGEITISNVKTHYLEDLKNRYESFQVQSDQDLDFPNAKARRIRTSGVYSHEDRRIDSIVIIHNGQPYIIESLSNPAGAPAAAAAIDVIVSHWKWMDK